MQVTWSAEALNDLTHLREFIRKNNPTAGHNIAERILETVDMLRQHPSMGRVGRVPSTREMVVSGTPYLLPYTVAEEQLIIVRVLHGAMQWPQGA